MFVTVENLLKYHKNTFFYQQKHRNKTTKVGNIQLKKTVGLNGEISRRRWSFYTPSPLFSREKEESHRQTFTINQQELFGFDIGI